MKMKIDLIEAARHGRVAMKSDHAARLQTALAKAPAAAAAAPAENGPAVSAVLAAPAAAGQSDQGAR